MKISRYLPNTKSKKVKIVSAVAALVLIASGFAAYAMLCRPAPAHTTLTAKSVTPPSPAPVKSAPSAPSSTEPITDAKDTSSLSFGLPQKAPVSPQEDKNRIIRFSDTPPTAGPTCQQRLSELIKMRDYAISPLTTERTAALAEVDRIYNTGGFATDPNGKPLTLDQQQAAYQLARSTIMSLYEQEIDKAVHDLQASIDQLRAECGV